MVFRKLLGPPPKRGIRHKDIQGKKALVHVARLETAFFRIGSVISAHKDLNAVLEVIAQECLSCLKAHRSAIFLLDEKSGILKTQYLYTLDPLYERVGLNEEKELAKKTLRQNKPLLLQGPEEFSEFFKERKQEWRITSLMSIPLFSKGKAMGVLSVVLINERYCFEEKSLQFLSSFAIHASNAMEMAHLHEEVGKEKNFRLMYERYLDDIMKRLQSLPERERQRMDSHIAKLQAQQEVDEKRLLGPPAEEKVVWVHGTILWNEESGVDRRKDREEETIVRVEFEGESSGFTGNFHARRAFIWANNPVQVGKQFPMKLHLFDGGEPVEVVCIVTSTNEHEKENSDLGVGMGVKFLNLEPESERRIEEYIQSQKNPMLNQKFED
jgi:hypothetical protein